MSDKVQDLNPSKPKSNLKKLLICFLVGFLVTFIGMLFLSQGYYDGKSVRNTNLWQFYVLTFTNNAQRAGMMGLGSQNATVEVVLTHLSISLAVGVAFAGIGWLSTWFRQRKSVSTNR